LLCGVVSHVNLTTELGGITVRVGIVTRFTEGLVSVPKVTFIVFPFNTLPKHIEKLFRLSTEGLDKNQKSEIKTLLSEYSDVFAQDDLDLGNFTELEHAIDTGTAMFPAKVSRHSSINGKGKTSLTVTVFKAR
jgi:hypothetical protein